MVEAKIVGEGCVIEVNARIGKGAVLGKVCATILHHGNDRDGILMG